MQNTKESKQRYYQRKRAEQITVLHQEKRNEFLTWYPQWEALKTSLKSNHRELLEKLHGLTPDYCTLQEIANERGVSKQAVNDAHKRALKAVEKLMRKISS